MRDRRAHAPAAGLPRAGKDRCVLDCAGRLGRGLLSVDSLGPLGWISQYPAHGVVHRTSNLRFFHDLFPRDFAVIRGFIRAVHETLRHSRSRRCGRFLFAGAGGHGRHVLDGFGQSFVDDIPGRRNGQRSVLRFGWHAQRPTAKQRSGLEIRRLRRRSGWCDAIRHQSVGGSAGNLSFADHGGATG